MTHILPPELAQRISSLVTSRSVAASMIDLESRSTPFNQGTFVYWLKAHREASTKLCEMGIDVITYDDDTIDRMDPKVIVIDLMEHAHD